MYLNISDPAVYHAALYIRLSTEDEKEGTSQSITNQTSLLKEFTEQHCLSVYDIYVDDGFSGTSFDRPDFNRMIRDIEDGKINMVITKDLSRLGRDYIMTGHYMERYFPEHNVRYISLLDGIDTGVASANNEITPFRAVMNDMYAKDISKKTKSVMRNKQEQGLYVGSKPPYGYKFHPDIKNKIIVDEEAAAIVRRLFAMAMSGMSSQKIADTLNEEHIPTPATYAGLPVGRPGPDSGLWQGSSITKMLKNEVYIGNMVSRRTEKISYKTKKRLTNSPEKWLIVKNTHEPIVDEDTFQAVASILNNRKSIRRTKYHSLLDGMIYCHECGAPLAIINIRDKGGNDRLFFSCQTYVRSPKSHLCTCHCIKVQTVTEAVLKRVHEECSKYLKSEDLRPIAQQTIANAPRQDSIGSEIQDLESQIRLLSANMDQVYSDKLDGLLVLEDFQRIYENLKAKRAQLNQELETLQQQKGIPFDAGTDLLTRVEKSIEEFTCSRELLAYVIDRIELNEDKQLFIKFRCKNPGASDCRQELSDQSDSMY